MLARKITALWFLGICTRRWTVAPLFLPSSCCRPSTTPFPREFTLRFYRFLRASVPTLDRCTRQFFLKLPLKLEMVVSLPKIFQFSPLPAPTYDSIIYRNALFFWDGEKRSFFFRKVGKEIYYHRKKLNDVITTTYYYIVPLLDYLTGCDPRCFDADHSLVSSFFIASFPRKFTLRCKLPYAPQCQNMDRSNGLFS